MPWFISFSAMGPCPWPSEMVFIFFENRISSANLSIDAYGSAPGERTKTMGRTFDESLKDVMRSNGGGSINCAPIDPLT